MNYYLDTIKSCIIMSWFCKNFLCCFWRCKSSNQEKYISKTNNSENPILIKDDLSINSSIRSSSNYELNSDNFQKHTDAKADNCYLCKANEGLIILDCFKCYLCNACLYNTFQSSLESHDPLLCSCSQPISYPKFQQIIQKDDLKYYLQKISSLTLNEVVLNKI